MEGVGIVAFVVACWAAVVLWLDGCAAAVAAALHTHAPFAIIAVFAAVLLVNALVVLGFVTAHLMRVEREEREAEKRVRR